MSPPPSANSRLGWTVGVLCPGTALSALNSGMVAVALATLRRDFGLDVATVTWVITVFYLTSAALQPLMGRLADCFGARRIFAAGMVIVIAAGGLGPFAPNFAWLCAARVLLAIGAATAFPAAAAMLRRMAGAKPPAGTPQPAAAKLIARIQIIDTSAGAVGPALGGVLIAYFGWEAIFWINVPLAAIALAGALLLVPRDDPRRRTPIRTTLAEADLPGVLFFVVAVAALVTFVLELIDEPLWWLLPVVPIAVSLFVRRELHFRKPFIDLRKIAAHPGLVGVYVYFILGSMVFYSVLFGIPQYLEDHAGFGTDAVGALLLPLAAFSIVLAPVVERLIDRRGLRTALLLGAAGLVIATLTLFLLTRTTAPVAILACAAAVGVAYGGGAHLDHAVPRHRLTGTVRRHRRRAVPDRALARRYRRDRGGRPRLRRRDRSGRLDHPLDRGRPGRGRVSGRGGDLAAPHCPVS